MASASLKTIICATLVAAMVSTTPALAGKGGGGGGNGGGGGGGGSHGGGGGHGGGGHSSSSSSHGKSASSHGKSTKSSKSSRSSQTASSTRKSSKPTKTAHLKSESLPKKSESLPKTALDVQPVPKPKEMASAFGKLNGFLHASPQALANAAPNSAIGLVAQGYADELGAYLAGEGDEASLADVKAALELASNKPLTAETVEAVNARLATLDPEIADAIDAYDGGEKGLAEAIAQADPSEVEVTDAGSLRGTVSP